MLQRITNLVPGNSRIIRIQCTGIGNIVCCYGKAIPDLFYNIVLIVQFALILNTVIVRIDPDITSNIYECAFQRRFNGVGFKIE